jgi:hypothetical protein
MKVAGSSIEVALSQHCGSEDILTGTAYLEELSSTEYAYPSQNNLHAVGTSENRMATKSRFSSHLTPAEFKEIPDLFEKTSQ